MAEQDAIMRGQADIWACMFAFAESMALRSALELGIPDIINSYGRAISLSQITADIKKRGNKKKDSPDSSPDATCLARIMRLLVRKRVFTAEPGREAGRDSVLYGLTPSSKWLLTDSELSLAPMVLMETHPQLVAPWHYLSRCVEDGGVAFEKAHGSEIWEFASVHPEFNKLFNRGMESSTKIVVKMLLEGYKEGFDGVAKVVDVGGGTGMMISEIVKAHPHVKGINFDLPHVVATAPCHANVEHVGGDMFVEVPRADVVIMKWIMHDWSNEDCIKILRNCRKAIPEKSGKVVIVDLVLRPEGDGLFDHVGIMFDLLMIAHSSGGKERTEAEWKGVLEEGGFPRYKIIQIPALPSLIEAYPI